MPLPIPTLTDINVHDSLDERVAVKNFLGKSLTEAQELFQLPSFYAWNDLMMMGPEAFCFYVRAAIAHLLSQDADGGVGYLDHFYGERRLP